MERNLKEFTLPQNLRISTRTATSKINSTIDLKMIYDNLEIDDKIKYIEYGTDIQKGESKKIISDKKKLKKKVFFNQITILIKIDYLYNNIKLFNNGSISMTGVKSEEVGKKSVDILFQKLLDINKTHKLFNVTVPIIEFYKIVLINSDYDIGYEIKRSELHQLLVNDYEIYSSYEPCIYPGVNSKFFWNKMYKDNTYYNYPGKCHCNSVCNGKGTGNGDSECKKVTISVFQSGSIIITGANSLEQIIDCYEFISGIFKKHESLLRKENPLNIDSSQTKKNKQKNPVIYIKKSNIVY
jgi:TATA-box binding protein (TBP) (component of TFIID and TFIIIB)